MNVKRYFSKPNLIVIFILLIVVIYIGQFALHYSDLRKENTSTWQEYSNNKEKYSLKYPHNWYLTNKNGIMIISSFNPEDKVNDSKEYDNNELTVWIMVQDRKNSDYLKSLVTLRKDKKNIMSEKVIYTDSGLKGYYVTFQSADYSSQDTMAAYGSYFLTGDKVYITGLYPYNSIYLSTYQTILSTFDIVK